MIDPNYFLQTLRGADVNFIAGVPDSLLKDFCSQISLYFSDKEHIMAANEGAAIGLAIGHYLSTGNIGLVYMQNSGLGNAINPILSLANPKVYGIPMVLMIGWRGELKEDGGSLKDEPQHVKQGEITLSLLEAMGIKYVILDSNFTNLDQEIKDIINLAINLSGPVAIVVRKGAFKDSGKPIELEAQSRMRREDAISAILEVLPHSTPIVSTTGLASRELFELRKRRSENHHKDFLTVGGMGHAISIASGIALNCEEKVLCLDGDGAFMMHTGSSATSAQISNLIHIVINNGVHDSVGAQPISAPLLDLKRVAKEFGYDTCLYADSETLIKDAVISALAAKGSSFIEIKCDPGYRKDLGRPDRSPRQNRDDFMKHLSGENE